MANFSHIPPADVAAVRRLDVSWAHAYFRRLTGAPFQAAHSEVTGAWMEVDEVALHALHRMRMVVGNKAEAQASREWLRTKGLRGAFGQPLDKN